MLNHQCIIDYAVCAVRKTRLILIRYMRAGNIFVQPGGRIALIDCGQVKQIPASIKLKLAGKMN